MSKHHVHALKDGQKTGPDQIVFSGDHIHELPNGEVTDEVPNSETHVHKLPDGSMTPGGPMPDTEENDGDNKT